MPSAEEHFKLGLEAHYGNRQDEARKHFTEAEWLHKQIGNVNGQANALDGLGRVESALNRSDEARKHFTEAERLHKQIGNVMGQANALQGLGGVERALNRSDEARKHFTEAVRLHKQIGNVMGQANALQGLGGVESALNRDEEAGKHFTEAERLHKQIGNVMGQADALDGLGNVERALNRQEEARKHFIDAERLHKQIGNVMGQANALQGLGGVERALNRQEEARKHFTEAERLHTQIGNVMGQANALQGLGGVERALGRPVEARAHFESARELCKTIGYRSGEANALFGLGETYRATGDEAQARKCFQDAKILYGLAGMEEWRKRAENMELAQPRKLRPKRLLKWFALALALLSFWIIFSANDQPVAISDEKQTAAGWTQHARGSKSAVIFVHGIFSGPDSAWGNWPALVAEDARIANALGHRANVFLAKYYTSPNSGVYKIEDAANELLVQLRTPQQANETPPLGHQQIIFIAHSTGGIVVRDVLERNREAFAGKKIGLVLMASPSRGSAWADRFEMISRTVGNKMAQQLSPDNDYLTNLDSRFADFVRQPPFALSGVEFVENRFIIPAKFKWLNSLFNFDRGVEPRDQTSYFGAPRLVPDTDHFSVVKPQNASDASHLYFVDYVINTYAKSAEK